MSKNFQRGCEAYASALCVDLPRCYVCEDASELLAAKLRGQKVAIIAGVRGFAASCARLGLSADVTAGGVDVTAAGAAAGVDAEAAQAAKNTAKALQIGAFSVYFTDLPERQMAEKIAQDIRQNAANMQIFAPATAATTDNTAADAGRKIASNGHLTARRLDDISTDATDATATDATTDAPQEPADADGVVILAIGGGVVCDVAKLTAHLLGARIFTLPSIAATCAAASNLSVLYEGAEFAEFASFAELELQMIADLGILRAAPRRYLLAGIGDTLAKFYESRLQQRGAELDYSGYFGAAAVALCRERLLDERASFEQVAMTILHATAVVSRTIEPEHNGALAHAICYALHAQGARGLHGELVAYGLLAQALILRDEAAAAELRASYSRLGLAQHLGDFMAPEDFCAHKFAADVLAAPDVANLLARGEALEAAVCAISAQMP